MLEKPKLSERSLAACLVDAFDVRVRDLTFLPLGADQGTAVYRAVADSGDPYFVKLRREPFVEISVTLPRALADQGLRQVIAPLAARSGCLWADLGDFRVILYPYVDGHDGYERCMSDRQWAELGHAFRQIHTAALPPALAASIPLETYSHQWRDSLRAALAGLGRAESPDPIEQELVAFLEPRREEVLSLLSRAELLAQVLLAQPREPVLCHTDLHAGNVLIADSGALYLVDWDAPLLAPKERDLMSVGAGLMGNWHTPEEEMSLFYAGYGPARIDPIALAYYRYERIIDDLAVECEVILAGRGVGEDRARELQFPRANFQPGGTIQLAVETDTVLKESSA